ncbi:MAG: HAMP domain-containing histidine kinase [Rhodospirillaceae bacterium]|nr:HAMP domain-containing histidine kinase [Rhodospirillaceae bacterium]
MLRLINDVLDLARIDSGHFPLAVAPVNLARVCRDVLGSFMHIAAERSVSLTSNCDEAQGRDEIEFTVTADPMRVTQVLMNLVSNAIKYNRHGGQVAVTIKSVNDRMIRLAVSDTGQGIPLDKQPEVFQHFNRLGAEARAVEGTGIGLALSKRLIEEMDGVIGFESQPSARTTFWFELPRSASGDLRTGLDGGVATFLHAAQ